MFASKDIRRPVGILRIAALSCYVVFGMISASTAMDLADTPLFLTGGAKPNLIMAIANSTASGVRLFDRHRLLLWTIAGLTLAALGAMLAYPRVGHLFALTLPQPPVAFTAFAVAVGAGGWYGAHRFLQRQALGDRRR